MASTIAQHQHSSSRNMSLHTRQDSDDALFAAELAEAEALLVDGNATPGVGQSGAGDGDNVALVSDVDDSQHAVARTSDASGSNAAVAVHVTHVALMSSSDSEDSDGGDATSVHGDGSSGDPLPTVQAPNEQGVVDMNGSTHDASDSVADGHDGGGDRATNGHMHGFVDPQPGAGAGDIGVDANDERGDSPPLSKLHALSSDDDDGVPSGAGDYGSDAESDVEELERSIYYALEAENERLRDELGEARHVTQACNARLKTCDADIEQLVHTVEELALQQSHLKKELATQQEAASKAAAAHAQQVAELQRVREEEAAAAAATIAKLQSELRAARAQRDGANNQQGETRRDRPTSTRASESKGQSGGGDGGGGAAAVEAEFYMDQLVIAKTKLAEAQSRNDVHIKKVRDLEEQLAHVKLQLANATAESEDNAVWVAHYRAANQRRDEQVMLLTRKLEASQATAAAQAATLEAYRTGRLKHAKQLMKGLGRVRRVERQIDGGAQGQENIGSGGNVHSGNGATRPAANTPPNNTKNSGSGATSSRPRSGSTSLRRSIAGFFKK